MQILYIPFADECSRTHWACSFYYIKGLQIMICFMKKLLKYPELLLSQGRFFIYIPDTKSLHIVIPPQIVFVGSILCSRCPSVRVPVRPSVTFYFLNILKNHCWNFIKP